MKKKNPTKNSLIKANYNEIHPAMTNAQGDLRVRVGSESDIDNAIWQAKRKPSNVVCHKNRDRLSRRLSWEYSASAH